MMQKKPEIDKQQTKRLKIILVILVALFLSVMLVLFVFAARVFLDVKATTEEMYQPIERKTSIDKLSKGDKKAFSILLLGIDTGALGRTEQGRSDTILLAIVDPKKDETVLLSLPRDTYTEIAGYGEMDKLNHAYAFGGPAMAMATVEQLLNIPINYYVSINMEGIESLVDEVGGVQIANRRAFTYDGTEFPVGLQQLKGADALKYVRMRYDDPEGDYGRQARQRQLIQAMTKQILSIDGLMDYQAILSCMKDNVSTNMTFNEMRIVLANYRSAFQKIEAVQLQGEDFMENNISYQRIPAEELTEAQKYLKERLDQ